jgi:hypothetical protein
MEAVGSMDGGNRRILIPCCFRFVDSIR